MRRRDTIAYRAAAGFTIVYSILFVAAAASGTIGLQSLTELLAIAVVTGVSINVVMPLAISMIRSPVERPIALKRGLPLIVAGAALNGGTTYAAGEYFFKTGVPFWGTWFVAMLLGGAITLLATFLVMRTPPTITAQAPETGYIGALPAGTTWLSGARVLPAPTNAKIRPGVIEFGGIPLDWRNEVFGGLFIGMPGVGKSQLGGAILRAVNGRYNSRAVILDFNGEYYALYGRPNDVVVNPFSPISAAWSPFAEIKGPTDYKRLAASFVPLIEGPNREWSEYGRDLLADTLRAMTERKDKNPQKLYSLLTGPSEELFKYLEDAGLQGWTSQNTIKMGTSAKTGIKPYIAIFEYLQPDGNFSIRDWIMKGDGGEGNLFVPYRVGDLEIMRQFVAAIADIALVEALSLRPCQDLPEDEHRRLFFLIDEMDSIGKISRLLDGLTKLRKYGCSIWLGIQTVPQIQIVYGEKETESMIGVIGNTVILKQKDLTAAEGVARYLGKQTVKRTDYTMSEASGSSAPQLLSMGNANSSTGKTINEQKYVDRDVWVVSPTDLMAMPRMQGILVGSDMVHYHIKIAKTSLPSINDPFRAVENPT